MPTWVVVLGAIAFVITSIYTIWTKAIRPGARVIAEWERMLPVWRDATNALEDVPQAFNILKEIVSQVRTNSGSSILDMIRNLTKQAEDTKVEAHSMAVQLEADRQLAIRDREQISLLLLQQDRTAQRLDHAISELSKMATANDVVANNLANAQARADEAPLDPGAAADAASKPAPPEG